VITSLILFRYPHDYFLDIRYS